MSKILRNAKLVKFTLDLSNVASKTVKIRKMTISFFSYLLHDLKSFYKSKCFVLKCKITKVQQRENRNLRNDSAIFFKKIKERLRNNYANR